jgi:hypothetical protein
MVHLDPVVRVLLGFMRRVREQFVDDAIKVAAVSVTTSAGRPCAVSAVAKKRGAAAVSRRWET